MKHKLILVAAALMMFACNKTQDEGLDTAAQAKMDSLQSIINEGQYTITLLDEIGNYLDTIESNRNYVIIDLEMGMTEESYIARMRKINEYTRKAEYTIGELEKTRSAYASQVKRMKGQIAELDKANKELQLSVAMLQVKNKSLDSMLTMSNDELAEAHIQILNKDQVIIEKEKALTESMSKVKLTEAEIFYARGEGMEAVSERVQFAPKRKKLALTEALQNYEKSYELGYGPALIKINELKAKL